MRPRYNVSDEQIDAGFGLLREELAEQVEQKGLGIFVSSHEISGVVDEEVREMHAEVERNRAKQLKHELLQVAVAALWGVISLETGEMDWPREKVADPDKAEPEDDGESIEPQRDPFEADVVEFLRRNGLSADEHDDQWYVTARGYDPPHEEHGNVTIAGPYVDYASLIDDMQTVANHDLLVPLLAMAAFEIDGYLWQHPGGEYEFVQGTMPLGGCEQIDHQPFLHDGTFAMRACRCSTDVRPSQPVEKYDPKKLAVLLDNEGLSMVQRKGFWYIVPDDAQNCEIVGPYKKDSELCVDMWENRVHLRGLMALAVVKNPDLALLQMDDDAGWRIVPAKQAQMLKDSGREVYAQAASEIVEKYPKDLPHIHSCRKSQQIAVAERSRDR